jgi:hypothetical protein
LMIDRGIDADEFERRYDGAMQHRDEGTTGEDLDWIEALGVEECFKRHLAEIKLRHFYGSGKRHGPYDGPQ